MSSTKKMHYIPRFYLKNFACDVNDHIFMLNKANNQIYKPDIENAAEENRFYDLGLEDFYKQSSTDVQKQIDDACRIDYGKKFSELSEKKKLNVDQWLEDFFQSNVETPLSAFFSEILKNFECRNCFAQMPFFFADNNSKNNFSKMFGLLFVRTKWYRENLRHVLLESAKQICIMESAFYGKSIQNDFSVDLSKYALKINHISEILSEIEKPVFGNVFAKKIWLLSFNETGIPYCCSDNYFTLIETQKRGNNSYGIGLETPGVELWLPISPNIMLSFHDPNFVPRKYDGYVFRQIKKKLVLDNNIEIVHQSFKYCFCNKENELNRIQKKCSKNPDILKPQGFIKVGGK